MKRIVLDTNTLISAIGWKDGNPRQIFDECMYDKYELVESLDLIKEFLEVIQRPKFNFISDDDKQEFLMNLMSICEVVEPKKKLEVIREDPDDNMVLECAVEGRADYIISGDDHLQKLGEYAGIKIVSPKRFVDVQSPR